MTGSIEDGASGTGRAGVLDRIHPAWIGLGLALVALVVYILCNPARQNFYDHFVWQADAWLHGRAAITWPVSDGPFTNAYFQDVYPCSATGPPPLCDPNGYGLLPFVALFGLATNAALVAAVLGAINVGLCWRMVTRVTERRGAAVLATAFYGFGTVAWYAAMLGSTWFLAHVVASTFLFIGITAALDAEARQRVSGGVRLILGVIDPRQFLAGLLFGMAATARLTTILGAPFFAFVGGGGNLWRRAFSAALGAAIPVAMLLGYNVITTGHPFHPGYDYLARTEYHPKADFYHADWAIEDPRYVIQNAQILFLWPPQTPASSDPVCTDPNDPNYHPPPTGLGIIFDPTCPILRPDPLGMSLLLTSPAYLLAIPPLIGLRRRKRRLVVGAGLAVGAVALVNLMHFSQGWVQFGYRFSNDFAPFAMIAVALGIARLRSRWLAVALVVASIVINAWGVYWGVTLGW